jgi:RimJ/RimL family protein N-acetyltransferase
MSRDFEISTDPARLDLAVIHRFLSSSYWAEGRTREHVERSVAASLCFGVYQQGEQIGFARVVTDRTVFGYLMDVFVLPEHRGLGIGKTLIRAVLDHPDLQGLRFFALRTRDAHEFYASFGFRRMADDGSMMALATLRASQASAPSVNNLAQPIGAPIGSWTAPPHPPREPMRGRFCSLVPFDARYVADLYAANSLDVDGRSWTYLPYGPFAAEEDYRAWAMETCTGSDPLFHVIVDGDSRRPLGVAAYLRVQASSGSIEVGHIHFSPPLQRTRAATEAMYLMMQRAFALGFRRYEWKCDALNAPSRRAAERLGFTFEGVFRQATVYKGRNRDTAWYSVIDAEWPALAHAFDAWLNPDNFDDKGRQRFSLAAVMPNRRGNGTA